MLIVPLAQRPDLAAILADWHFAEWADLYPGWTIEACRAELESHQDPDRVPTTLVALEGTQDLLGSVSLLLEDLPGCESFSPWLASLYVRPDRRGRGLGSLLLTAALAEARRLGIGQLFLFTTAHVGYYLARGWVVVSLASAAGRPVTIMTRGTDGPGEGDVLPSWEHALTDQDGGG